MTSPANMSGADRKMVCTLAPVVRSGPEIKIHEPGTQGDQNACPQQFRTLPGRLPRHSVRGRHSYAANRNITNEAENDHPCEQCPNSTYDPVLPTGSKQPNSKDGGQHARGREPKQPDGLEGPCHQGNVLRLFGSQDVRR
jgi:hypothetical protein